MTESHKKSKSGNYYLGCTSMTSDEYYAGKADEPAKEPPGKWLFCGGLSQSTAASQMLALVDGKIFDASDSVAFSKLCRGFNPRTGKALVQNAGKKDRLALHDFTYSAPKSFSVVWGLGSPKARNTLAAIQDRATNRALNILSRVAYTRTGAQGKGKKEPVGLIAAPFEHGSSRADDPQLHTHAVVLNLGITADGRTGALETQAMMAWRGAAASTYHAELAWGARQIGAKIRMVGKVPEIDGISMDVLKAFSKRREVIEKAVEKFQVENGMSADASRASRGLLGKLAKETRDGKNEKTREELLDLWVTQGKVLGFTEAEVREVLEMGEPIVELTPDVLLEEARQAVAKLTDMDAVFTEPALYTAVVVHLCGRASCNAIDQAVEAVRKELVMTEVVQQRKASVAEMAGPPTVGMLKAALAIQARRLSDGEAPSQDQLNQASFAAVRAFLDEHAAYGLGNTLTGPEPEITIFYSTHEMVMIEADLQERARALAPRHRLAVDLVEDAIKARDDEIRAAVMADVKNRGREAGDASGLEEEQRAAIRHACLSDASVSVIEGTAGAGKTFSATTVASIFKEAGYEVHCLGSAWAQAINRAQEAQLDSGRAIAGWLNDQNMGELSLSPKSVVVLDESGMVGSRQMRDVIRAAQDAGAKVILLGDTQQQTAVSAGDALRIVTGQTGSARLDVIGRQSDAAERQAVKDIFAGAGKEGLKVYIDKGRVKIADDRDATGALLIADWQASREAHPLASDPKKNSHLIVAYDRATVRDLNVAAHEARSHAGELGERRLQLLTMDSQDGELLEFAEGDEVVFRSNNRGLNVEDKPGKRLNESYAKHIVKLEQLDPNEQRKKLRAMAATMRKNAHRDAQEISGQVAGLLAELDKQDALVDRLDRKRIDGKAMDKLRKHQMELADRLDAEQEQRATSVYNRVRGTLESLDPVAGTLTVRTEDGGLVLVNPKDEKWQHRGGGLAIQHGYATTVYASQGLTRGRVFGMDHTGLDRRAGGVMASRHREGFHLYVNREARYEAKMRHEFADNWHPLSEFDDEECLARLASGWSRESTKTSTLDYKLWKTMQGETVYVQEELQHERMLRALEEARREIEARPADGLFPFQEESAYEIKLEHRRAESGTAMQAREDLVRTGVGAQALMDAENAGFLDYLRQGEHASVVYLGRDNLATDGRVVNAMGQGGQRSQGVLRHEFPPTLAGDDPTRVVIVPSGQDALAVWTQADEAGMKRPSVLVVDSPEQLHPRTQHILTKAQTIDVTASPNAGLVAARARALATGSEVVETKAEPAREAERRAEAERARIADEELARKNEMLRDR